MESFIDIDLEVESRQPGLKDNDFSAPYPSPKDAV